MLVSTRITETEHGEIVVVEIPWRDSYSLMDPLIKQMQEFVGTFSCNVNVYGSVVSGQLSLILSCKMITEPEFVAFAVVKLFELEPGIPPFQLIVLDQSDLCPCIVLCDPQSVNTKKIGVDRNNQKHKFVRTKVPRMHFFSSEKNTTGRIFVPLATSLAKDVVEAYSKVSPRFVPEAFSETENDISKHVKTMLNVLFQNHPEQLLGKIKRMDLGYSVHLRFDEGTSKGGERLTGIVIDYPITTDYKQIRSILMAIYAINPFMPPTQYFCLSDSAIDAVVSVSVNASGTVLFDAETDMFALERLSHEQSVEHYAAHLLFHKKNEHVKIPQIKLFKSVIGVTPLSQIIDVMKIDHNVESWNPTSREFYLQNEYVVKIVGLKRISAYAFEMMSKALA